MSEAIIVALIVAGLGLLGTIVSTKYISNVTVVRLEMRVNTLESEVRKHNGVVDRTYALEKKVSLIEHDIQSMEKDIDQRR